MPSQGDFKDGELRFSELPATAPDLSRYQGAMFLDRPDLWPTLHRRRNGKPVPPEQQPLFKPE